MMGKESGKYEVGYGKPPREHRFTKGRSGNPGGRPKGARNKIPHSKKLEFGAQPANQMLLAEAYRPVTVREGDEVIQLAAIQAVFRSMSVNAVKGDRHSQRLLAELVQEIESSDRELRSEYIETMMNYKTDAERALERAQARGEPVPEIIPHPDDIYLDFQTPEAWILGPQTKEEKREWDSLLERRNEAQEEVSLFSNSFRKARKPERKAWFLKQWHFEQKLFDILNDNLPPRYRVKLKDRSWSEGASRPGDQKKRQWPNER